MQKGMNKFQTILLIIFAVGIFIGVALFAGVRPGGNEAKVMQGTIKIWGTLDDTTFNNALGPAIEQVGEMKIEYKKYKPEEFYVELVDALASGTGPDVILITGDDVVRQQSRIVPLAYTNFPKSLYNDMYVNSAQIFFTNSGVAAFPLFIDPLVMYYNKDTLSSNFLLDPPNTWDSLVNMVPDFTVATDSGGIEKSTVALGSFANVPHATDIISTLMMQLGNPIVVTTDKGVFESTFKDQTTESAMTPALSALQFYLGFTDKTQKTYSWNTSLPNARDAFLAGDLAFYLGYASEFPDIRRSNPNLNFGVTIIPQLNNAPAKVTYGRLYGLAVTRTTQNIPGAFSAVQAIASKDSIFELANAFHLPPVRRDLLNVDIDDPNFRVFYQSAIIARMWPKPDVMSTDAIIESLINDASSGRDSLNRLIDVADDSFADLYKKYGPKEVVPTDTEMNQ